MASHAELVSELAGMDKMPMSDRLKLAKKRRAAQLKAYAQYEKQLNKNATRRGKKTTRSTATAVQASSSSSSSRARNQLQFADSVLLLDATVRNDVDEVKKLLGRGVSSDSCNADGLTALHQCCIDDLDELLRLLIDNGADVNARDSEQWTPLHAAATCGHVKLCRYLCQHGAELLAVNADGNMPYDLCDDVATLNYIESEMARQGVTQQLIDDTRLAPENVMLSDMQNIANVDGDFHYLGRHGETPLHVAACNGYTRVVEFLLAQHVAVDAVDHDDWRPLHCAACWGQYVVVEILLEHGADIEAKTRNGETALDLCEDVEMKQRILELMSEMKTKRSSRLRLDATSSRRNSTTRRGSAVQVAVLCARRSSVHERRTSISVKDARDEAMRLRQSVAPPDDDDDDDDDGGQVLNAVTVASPPHVVKEDAEQSEPLASSSSSSWTHVNGDVTVSTSSPLASPLHSMTGTLHDLKKRRSRLLQLRLFGPKTAANGGCLASTGCDDSVQTSRSVDEIYGHNNNWSQRQSRLVRAAASCEHCCRLM